MEANALLTTTHAQMASVRIPPMPYVIWTWSIHRLPAKSDTEYDVTH